MGKPGFLSFYFLTGIAGSLIEVFIFRQFLHSRVFGMGASGAIMGIMGVFMVRCYFKRLVIPLPFFGFLYYRLRINSLIPLGFFLLRDVAGGARQLAGTNSSIGYWGHIGSMVVGALLAFIFKHHKAAVGEKFTAIGVNAITDPGFQKDGESALRYALEIDPHNEEALIALARKKSRTRLSEGRELFDTAIRLKLRTQPKEAVELYKEYLSAYNRMLTPSLQYRLCEVLHCAGDYEGAIRSLEMMVDGGAVSASMREKAFNQLVSLLSEAGLGDAARHRLRQFEEAFPASSMLPVARKKAGSPGD